MESRNETLAKRNLDDVLPNSCELGRKPDVLFGCNTSELSYLSIISLLPGFIVGIVLGFLIGFQFFPFFLFSIAAIVFVMGVRFLRRIKRQKPNGYYVQVLSLIHI